MIHEHSEHRRTPPGARAVVFQRFPRPRYRRTAIAAWLQLLLAGGFVGALAGAVVLYDYPREVPYLIASMSLLAMVFYGMDKLAALRNRQRTSEKTLHWLSVLGGWPGAILAQRLFHHKTSKREFRMIFWLTVAINCALVGWTFSSSGEEWLDLGLVQLRQCYQWTVTHLPH